MATGLDLRGFLKLTPPFCVFFDLILPHPDPPRKSVGRADDPSSLMIAFPRYLVYNKVQQTT